VAKKIKKISCYLNPKGDKVDFKVEGTELKIYFTHKTAGLGDITKKYIENNL